MNGGVAATIRDGEGGERGEGGGKEGRGDGRRRADDDEHRRAATRGRLLIIWCSSGANQMLPLVVRRRLGRAFVTGRLHREDTSSELQERRRREKQQG